LIDGVFAIAVTLLVLDLPKPEGSTRLAHDLLGQWPTYVAYLVSFVTSGSCRSSPRDDERSASGQPAFRGAHAAVLLFVSIISWPTSLAAQYADHGAQARVAAILYATTMLLLGSSFALGWRYLTRAPSDGRRTRSSGVPSRSP